MGYGGDVVKSTRYEGVTAYVGMPGSGKTYGLAQQAQRAMRRGVPVFTNAGFDVVGAQTFTSFQEFCDVIASDQEVVVCFDELPLYFNSRKWQEFPDAVMYYLTQIRKCRARLYYSAIHEQMVDVNVRRLTFWYWHCRALSGRTLKRALFPPEEFRRAQQRAYRREFVRVRESVTQLYDTMGRVSIGAKSLGRIAAVDDSGWVAPLPAEPVVAGDDVAGHQEPDRGAVPEPWAQLTPDALEAADAALVTSGDLFGTPTRRGRERFSRR